jgi:uncharacterized DUF497 family protein
MSQSLNSKLFAHIEGFDWDDGNLNKNQTKHLVSWQESESVFRNHPIIIIKDTRHSNLEKRFVMYGKTDNKRLLTIIFKIRHKLFRNLLQRSKQKKGEYMKTNKSKIIPKFSSEDEERDFWATHDTTEYFDIEHPITDPVFPNLKYSSTSISLRLPVAMLDQLKILANKRDVPYQSFVKTILADRLSKEFARQ